MSVISLRERITEDASAFGRAKRSASSLVLVRRTDSNGATIAPVHDDIELVLTVGKRWASNLGDEAPRFYAVQSAIKIAANSSIVVETAEDVSVPSNVMGIVFPKGSLFRERGVHPLTAKVDPTWTGNLTVLIRNSSDVTREIRPNEPIASIVFFSMESTLAGAIPFKNTDLPVVKRGKGAKFVAFLERPLVYSLLAAAVTGAATAWVTIALTAGG